MTKEEADLQRKLKVLRHGEKNGMRPKPTVSVPNGASEAVACSSADERLALV